MNLYLYLLSYFFFVLDKKQHTVPGAPGKLHKQQQQTTMATMLNAGGRK